jgi:hypothetical protein
MKVEGRCVLGGQQRPRPFWFKAEVGLKGELGGVGFGALRVVPGVDTGASSGRSTVIVATAEL